MVDIKNMTELEAAEQLAYLAKEIEKQISPIIKMMIRIWTMHNMTNCDI